MDPSCSKMNFALEQPLMTRAAETSQDSEDWDRTREEVHTSLPMTLITPYNSATIVRQATLETFDILLIVKQLHFQVKYCASATV